MFEEKAEEQVVPRTRVKKVVMIGANLSPLREQGRLCQKGVTVLT